MKEYVFLNDRPFKEKFPLRSVFYGEGVFETFRWKSRLPVFWDKHIERMRRGAGVLGIPFPNAEGIRHSIENGVLESKISDAYAKICLLSGGSSVFYENPHESALLIVLREYQPPKAAFKALVSPLKRSSSSPLLGIKSLNYLENVLARREAVRLGFDEAIFLNERGELTEGGTSNIFWLNAGVLYTPSPECGVLPGIIRSVVIELAIGLGIEVIEGLFDLSSLTSSQEVFFSNSLIGIQPVVQVNEVELVPEAPEFLAIRKALLERLKWL